MAKSRTLGRIMHILNKEAIVRPDQPIVAKGARVLVDNVEIGSLDDPFGPVFMPFQAIRLYKKFEEDQQLVGKTAIVASLKQKKKYHKPRSKPRKK